MKNNRYTFLNAFILIVFIAFIGKLVNLQVARGEYYREKSDARTTRSVELIAPRGQILDRYGRIIVGNKTGYRLYIQSNIRNENASINRVVYNLLENVSETSEYMAQKLPIQYDDGEYIFIGEDKDIKKWKKENNYESNLSAKEIVKRLDDRYFSKEENFTKQMRLEIAGVRLDMSKRGFSISTPYLFMEDASLEEIVRIKEQSEKFPDVSIVAQPVREYPYKSLGAHILGRVGLVSAEEYENKKEDGYSMNANIGKGGIEKNLEDYLRGENGRGSVEQTENGYSISQNMEKEPIAGRDVNLTIDLDMQIACENALKETIEEIRRSAVSSENGGGADSGSAVVVDVNTGEILAMASYPSYDIESFSKDYSILVNEPSKPLFNRSLSGTYSPASTFKILIGAAALEENIIKTDEEILDTGKYKYFRDYQPTCWIYGQTGGTHGYENVSEAIRDSCNVFFYDVGRRLGIEKINSYAKKFGFGQKSGIELADEEKAGVVASPENRKKNSGIWYPGDVCQTAIGQSDTLVTPLQLANYIATIANGGTRYRPHIIKSVQKANRKESTQTESEVLSYVKLKKENYEAISSGIRMVVTEGTGFNSFLGCKTKVAAKTGSAQTSGNHTNGICVAFAPYDNPRIAIACVIEKAGSGSKTAGAVRKIVDSYFDAVIDNELDEFNTLSK